MRIQKCPEGSLSKNYVIDSDYEKLTSSDTYDVKIILGSETIVDE